MTLLWGWSFFRMGVMRVLEIGELLLKEGGHSVLPPKLWERLFGSQKIFWGSWIFFCFKGGARLNMWGLAKIGCEGGIQLWKIELYICLFFQCLNLARLYSCIILIVLSWLYNNLCTEFFLIVWLWWLFVFI